jgi:UDP-2,3-diacylglucosamine pyrophosphatase LpxH
MIHILHFSDIHLGTSADATKYLTQLETDLRRELEIQKLEYLVLSGDAGDYATPEEYQAAFELVDGVLKRFGLDPSRVVIVPGNHDLNWDLAKQAYDFQWKTPGAKPLPEGAHIPAGEQGDLVRNDAKYRQRFAHFSEHFYKRIYSGQTYPTEYADQVLLTVRPDDCILFLGLNSAWQIDHYNCKRAGIYMNALSSALNQLHDHRYNDWLKIAVFHHPVAGRQMMNDEFMELLAVNGFQICMHGHVHEAMDTSFKYDDARGIRVIGAGTFGAAAKDQVAGVPLQYNLLELDKAARKITVRTRRKEKPDGAWMADARWGDKKKDPKAWYEITLKEGTFGGGCNP